MEEGTIAKWHVKEGNFVKAGDVLMEVATDKATVEHGAIDEGFLRKILVKDGESAIVNQAIAIFTEKKEESIEGYQPEGAVPAQAAEKKEALAKEEKPSEEKTKELVKAPSGALQQPAFVPEPPLEHYAFEEPSEPIHGRLLASPLARKLASEKGIDLSTIKGSGPHGRIISRDLEKGQPTTLVSFVHRKPEIPPGTFEEEALAPMRKTIGRRLQESKTFIPHFYVTQEIQADHLVSLREQLQSSGLKFTYNDFVLRATALALRQHPEINSGFNSVNQTIIRFKTIDISVAVSIEAGLITPIIRHIDYKNLGQISVEARSLTKKAKAGKLAREEYVGGSFTVSNLGMFGISSFVGVINPPQAAILAVGGIQEKALVRNGQIALGKTFFVTLSADHRVIDGTDAAKFLVTLKQFLENPSLLLV